MKARIATRYWIFRTLFVAVSILLSLSSFGQLNGTKNVPGDYPTLAAAIADLNLQGVGAGGVTINLLSGNPETAPAGGYIIGGAGSALLTSSSTGNQVILEGNGNVITAGLQTATNLNDAVFKLLGADWITIRNFTIQENAGNTTVNVSTNTMTEWGIALLHASLTDGCQNNSILNNNISLNKTYLNTWAIYSNVRHNDGPASADVTTANDITNGTTGPNSGNKVYGNTIGNVNLCIAFIGSSTDANMDTGNDIGGTSLSTANIMTNWGGSAAPTTYVSNLALSYGVFMNHQKALNVSYNTLVSASVSVSGTFSAIYADYVSGSPTGTFTNNINNNTITLTNNVVGTFQIQTIRHSNTFAAANANATVNLNNNLLQNFSVTGVATGITIFGVLNTANFGTANLNGNTFRGATSSSTTAGFVAVSNQGAVVNTININNNKVGDNTAGAITFTAANSGAVTALFNSAGAATANLSISNNDIRGIVSNVTGTNAMTFIANSAATLSQNFSNNTFTNLNINSTGGVTFFSNSVTMPAGGSQTVNNNSIVTAFVKSGAGGQVAVYIASTTPASPTGTTHTATGNNFSNITVSGATTIFGWANQEGAPGPAKIINNNTFSNWSGGTGGITVITSVWSGSGSSISGNTISNISSQGAITAISRTSGGSGPESVTNNTISNLISTGTGGTVIGITGGTTGITTYTISGNSISGLSSSGASSTVTGIAVTAGATVNVSSNVITGLTGTGTTTPVVNGITVSSGTSVTLTRNKICNLAQNGTFTTTASSVNGISITGGTTVTATNNLIGDLRAPNETNADAIRGISVTSASSSTSYNLYHNTIYLEASSTGATFGTTGIYHAASATATTAKLDLRNNIVVNNSTPGATAGVVSALRRSVAATYGNYATTSNNNLYYAGTPAANRAILNDNGTVYGTAGSGFAFGPVGTVGSFQNQVTASRESLSFTEVVSNSPGVFFQSLTCSDPNFLHLVNGLITRAEGGGAAGTGVTVDYDNDTRNAVTPDVGADEFNGVSPAPVFSNVTIPTATCTPTAHVINADITIIAGSISTVTLNYNNGSAGSTTMTLVSGNTYTGTIPAGGSGVGVTWSITATGSNGLSSVYTGSGYKDEPLFGLTVNVSASVNPVCSGSASVLTATLNGLPSATYTAPPAVSNPVADEDLGNVTITQGLTTILNNTTAGGSLTGTIGTASGTAGSYSNFTAFGPYQLVPGTTYNISLTSITQGGNFGNALAAWIDFNLDGDFNDAGEQIYNQGATITGPHTSGGSFTVPANASLGLTRLRVLVNEGTVTGPTMAVSWGEYEEYSIKLMYDVTAYSWFDGTNTFSTSNPVTVNPVSATTYTATLTALGCPISNAGLLVNTNTLPAAPLTAPSVQCGTGVPICFAAGTSNGNYRWYTTPTGGTAIPGEVNDALTSYSISATTTFYVAISDGTCESLRTPVVATVNPPDALSASSNGPVCANSPLSLTATVTSNTNGNVYTYTWSASPASGSGIPGTVAGGTGTFGAPATTQVTPTAGGTYTYTVTAVDAGQNCSTTATVSVLIKSLPEVSSVTATPSTVCAGAPVNLKVTSNLINAGPGTLPGTYCVPTQSGSADIQTVVFNQINHTDIVQPSPYYNIYPATGSTTTTLDRGQTYTFTASTNGASIISVWIDFNRNGQLEASEWFQPWTAAASGSQNITIPLSASVGATTMRVRTRLSGNTNGATDACSSFGSGTAVDYTVYIRDFVETNPNYTYGWTWAPSGSQSGAAITVNPLATTSYTATVSDPVSGCSNTGSVNVTVNPLPPAPSSLQSEQCGTGIPTASVSSNSGAPSPVFNWYLVPSGGTAVQSLSPSTTYTQSINSTTTFYVSEVSEFGCEGPRVAVTATVNTPDPVTAQANSVNICLGATVTLDALHTPDFNVYQFNWSAVPVTGGGLPVSTNTQQIVAQPTLAGTYTYTVTAYDPDKECTTTGSVTVTVNPVPTNVTASSTNLSVCTGSTVNLSASSLSNVYTNYSYTQGFESAPTLPSGWTFINAGTSPNQWNTLTNTQFAGAAHTGNAALYYNWDASNAANAWAITPAQTLAAGKTYTISFWYRTASVGGTFPEKMKVTIGTNNNVASQTTILWNNNGGINLTNETYAQGTVTFTPVTAGNYYVGFHCYSDADNNFMMIDDVSITGQTEVPSTYSWTSSPAGFTSNLQNPTNVVVNANTTFTVTAINNTGCSSPVPGTVTVNAIPLPAQPLANNSTQCGTAVPSASVSTGGANGTFKWYDAPTGGTLLQNGGSTYASLINTTTTFYVAEFDGTCESLRTPVTVTVTTPPALSVNSSGSNTFCLNDNRVLTAAGDPGYVNFSWSATPPTGAGLSSNSNSPVTITPTLPGTYTYTLLANDGQPNGCSNTATITVTVNPNPVIDSVRVSPASICVGGSATLNGYSSIYLAGPQTAPNSYCTPIQSGSAQITSVTFNTLSNTGISQVSPYYDIYPFSGNTTTSVNAGQTYTLSLATSGTSIVSVWIDYNRNGNFETSEWIQPWTSAASGTVSIAIPVNAASGATVMRIRSRLSGNTNGSTDACTSFGSGVSQDYVINILGLNLQNPNYTFTWNPGSLTGATQTVSPAVTTSYTLTVTDPLTTCSTQASPVTVNVLPVGASASASPATPVCAGATVTLNAGASGGGPFGYSWSDGTSVISTSASPVVNPTATTTYTVTVTDACNNSTTSQVTVTVNPLPTAAIAETGPISICSPNTQQLTAQSNATSPIYQWTLNGANISGANGPTYTVSGVSSGLYRVVVTESGTGCINTSAPVSVTILASPTNLVATASTNNLCTGSSVNLFASADAPLPVTVSSLNFESGLGGWTTFNTTSGSNPAAAAWTIRPNPYTSTNTTPVTFNSGSGANFILSNPDLGGSGTTVNAQLVSPSFSTVGLSSLSISFKHYYRLFTSGEASIEVSTNGGTSWTIAKTYTATQGAANAFVADNVSLNAFIGQPAVQVRFSYVDGWAWYWAIDDILITGTPSSYNYSWTSSPAGFTSNVQNPTAVTPTVNTTYTVQALAANGCTASASTTVNLIPRPTALISGSGVFCQDAPNTSTNLTLAFTGTGPWNYTISGGASPITGTTSSNPLTVTVTPSSATPQVFTYTVTALSDANCTSQAGDLTGSATITINPLAANPTATVTHPTCALATGSITMTAPLGAGNSYTLDGTTTITWPTITFTGVAPGNHTITVANSFGCSAPASASVTVNPQPFTPGAPVVSGPTNVCAFVGSGTPVTYTATATGFGNQTFNWILPPNVTLVSGAGTGTITVTFAAGFSAQANKQIRLTVSNQCGTSPQVIYYLLAQYPSTPATITASSTDVCAVLGTSTPITFTIPKAPGAASYIWSAQPGTTTITSVNGPGANDTSVTVTFASGFTTSAITVQAVNSCGVSGTRSLTITKANPATPGLISGPTNVCAYIAPGPTATYSVPVQSNVATYIWTLPAGATNITYSGATNNQVSFNYPTGYSGGTISVVGTNGCGTSTTPRSLAVATLSPATPSVIDVINTVTCADPGPDRVYSYSLSGMPANATSVQWTIPAAGTITGGQGTASITVSYPPTAVVGTVTATSVNNCGSSTVRSVDVKLPACPPEFASNSNPQTKGATLAPVPVDGMEVKVFPNPTVSDFKLQVQTSSREMIHVRVLDMTGREYRLLQMMPGETLSLGAQLKAGSYILEVRQGKTLKTTKVLKF